MFWQSSILCCWKCIYWLEKLEKSHVALLLSTAARCTNLRWGMQTTIRIAEVSNQCTPKDCACWKTRNLAFFRYTHSFPDNCSQAYHLVFDHLQYLETVLRMHSLSLTTSSNFLALRPQRWNQHHNKTSRTYLVLSTYVYLGGHWHHKWYQAFPLHVHIHQNQGGGKAWECG